MAGVRKPTPIEAFRDNIADAHQLVKLVEGFTNTRKRRMRVELRRRLGEALSVPERRHAELDCLQSEDVFVTFLPGSNLSRTDFVDARPLLRQALVAACAAVETYLADKVMQNVGPLLKDKKSLTPKLRLLPMTLDDWMTIEDRYKRRRWGLREFVVEPWVREKASTKASQVGLMLRAIGVENWAARVDEQRHVKKGDTVAFLDRITDRRNRIAHAADRVGRGRAALTIAEVRFDLHALESVIEAIEAIRPAP